MSASRRRPLHTRRWTELSIALLLAAVVLALGVSASVVPSSSLRQLDGTSLHSARGAPPLFVVLAASPSPLTLGQQTNLSVIRVTGYVFGVTWSAYNWTVLPVGCNPANRSNLNCTPSETGTFNVSVTVTDSANQSGIGTTLVTVTNPSSSSLFSAATLYLLSGVIGIVAAAVTAVVIVSYWRRRRRSAPVAPMPESPYVPPEREFPRP